jgi:hypothetical protein
MDDAQIRSCRDRRVSNIAQKVARSMAWRQASLDQVFGGQGAFNLQLTEVRPTFSN